MHPCQTSVKKKMPGGSHCLGVAGNENLEAAGAEALAEGYLPGTGWGLQSPSPAAGTIQAFPEQSRTVFWAMFLAV